MSSAAGTGFNLTSGVPIRALELFSGIGGFAAATRGIGIRVVAAYDRDAAAMATYRHNFPEQAVHGCDLEKITPRELADHDASLWWLSPPCQPYSVRGARRDLDDFRARSFLRILQVLQDLADDRLPVWLALENVAGFRESRGREQLLRILANRGFAVGEQLLCPTELGIPSRRPRYYLMASRLNPPLIKPPQRMETRPLREFLSADLDAAPPAELLLDQLTVARFGAGFRILEPDDPTAYTTCFTSGYGRVLMAAGAYLRCGERVRFFAPEEIARLLGFPATFSFPEQLSVRRKWGLVGNSLSVAAVRHVLGSLFPPDLN